MPVPPLLVLAALFLIYPNRTIIFAPDWIIFAFSTASISLLCAGAILFVPGRIRQFYRALPIWFKCAFGFFALIAILHIAKNIEIYSLADIGRSIAYLTLPLFAALYKDELRKMLPWALALLWLLTVAQSFAELLWLGRDVAGGLPMNRNWNATLILISMPFAIFLSFRWSDSILKRFLALLIIVLPSLGIFMQCNSLAAYLAIPAALYLFFLMNRKHWKIFLGATAALLIFAVATFFFCKAYSTPFRNYLEQDDRIELLTASVRMIADAPVSGYGIPSFEQEFLPYIRTESYYLRDHATDRANHPHNHLLFVAAGMGLVGLATWLALWLAPVLLHSFRRKQDSAETPLDQLIFFAWLVLAFHSMMDLVLFQEPTNILGLLFTGLIWVKVFKPEVQEQPDDQVGGSLLLLVRCCGVLWIAIALVMAICNLSSAVNFRMSHRLWLSGQKQEAQKHIRLMLLTAHWDNSNYYLYQSALRLPPEDGLKILNQISAGSTPDLAHINLHRGRLLMVLNQPEEAEEALLRDAALYPLHIEALYDLWMIALFDRNENAAKLLAEKINYRLKKRGLDARITNPFPAPQDARISGPDVDEAMTYKVKR